VEVDVEVDDEVVIEVEVEVDDEVSVDVEDVDVVVNTAGVVALVSSDPTVVCDTPEAILV
jgi:hypothetical protein